MEALLPDLKRKSALVEWNREKRDEHYCIIAKTFKRRTSAAICVDVNDIKTLLLPK